MLLRLPSNEPSHSPFPTISVEFLDGTWRMMGNLDFRGKPLLFQQARHVQADTSLSVKITTAGGKTALALRGMSVFRSHCSVVAITAGFTLLVISWAFWILLIRLIIRFRFFPRLRMHRPLVEIDTFFWRKVENLHVNATITIVIVVVFSDCLAHFTICGHSYRLMNRMYNTDAQTSLEWGDRMEEFPTTHQGDRAGAGFNLQTKLPEQQITT